PPDTPHSVTNGPGVSASLSIPFYTPVITRGERVHAINAWLRRRGGSPRPPGESAVRDRTKSAVYDVWRVMRHLRPSRG
ncbi:MAG TPA: transcriptional regulator, partial [Acidimicrobiia bacterium]